MMYVYVICSEAGPVKIGISRQPEKRLHNLQTGHHAKLSLVYAAHFTADGAATVEHAAHAVLDGRGRRGEWFEVSGDEAMAAVIKAAADLGIEQAPIPPPPPPKKRGRPKLENPKVAIKIRIDHDIVAAFKAGGRGWQTRMALAFKDIAIAQQAMARARSRVSG